MWTREYCGIQHLGEFSLRQTWITVERHSTWAILLEWFPGCAFSPKETRHSTVEAAKQVGESIMSSKV